MPVVFLIVFFLSSQTAQAQDTPQFHLPIACTPGEDCWVLNYVDMGPDDQKAADYTCGLRTYDGHKGTDIAIRDLAVMNSGVDVLAARSGTVKKIRDGEPDRFPTPEELQAVKDARRECGNAVLIDHGNALQTIYCHLKNGSITVRPGDPVDNGDKIGEVGLSGYTQFPHIHLGILWEGGVMDPFTGLINMESCGDFRRTLWHPDVTMTYHPVALYHAGFDSKAPDLDDIDQGHTGPESVSPSVPALTFWSSILGVVEGDRIVMNIRDPDGKIFAKRTIVQPKSRARQFYYTGRKLSSSSLKPGSYTGTTTLTRAMADGQDKSWSISRTLSVEGEDSPAR